MADQSTYFNFFLSHIRTKEQMVSFLEELAEAKEEVFRQEGVLLSKKLGKKVSEDFKARLEKAEEKDYLPKDAKEEANFLDELGKYLLKLPILKLTIAFTPAQEFFEKLEKYLSDHGKEKIIFDIEIKEEIVAGALIEAEGEFRDYTIGKEIDQVLEKSKLVV